MIRKLRCMRSERISEGAATRVCPIIFCLDCGSTLIDGQAFVRVNMDEVMDWVPESQTCGNCGASHRSLVLGYVTAERLANDVANEAVSDEVLAMAREEVGWEG